MSASDVQAFLGAPKKGCRKQQANTHTQTGFGTRDFHNAANETLPCLFLYLSFILFVFLVMVMDLSANAAADVDVDGGGTRRQLRAASLRAER